MLVRGRDCAHPDGATLGEGSTVLSGAIRVILVSPGIDDSLPAQEINFHAFGDLAMHDNMLVHLVVQVPA